MSVLIKTPMAPGRPEERKKNPPCPWCKVELDKTWIWGKGEGLQCADHGVIRWFVVEFKSTGGPGQQALCPQWTPVTQFGRIPDNALQARAKGLFLEDKAGQQTVFLDQDLAHEVAAALPRLVREAHQGEGEARVRELPFRA